MSAALDFETYSEADLRDVGAWKYAKHPTTEVLCCAYNLGAETRLWHPGLAPPTDLFEYVKSGGHIEAHNAFFEFCIWWHICYGRMGWPALLPDQLSCSMAKAM